MDSADHAPAPAPALRPLVVIPARMAATRLPGKPLASIGGRAMILHVLDRARDAGIGPVVVACAERAITEVVEAAGGRAVLTEPGLPSGSDRVHAALAVIDPEGRHDVVVNLQGDLPLIAPADIARVLRPLADPACDIATLVAPVRDAAEAARPSVVKAACQFAPGRDVAPVPYFSRAAVPWGEGPLWHHIGIYAWRRAALDRFVRLPPSPLETREKLEQLRAIEAGLRIAAAAVARAPLGVDTADDLDHVRAEFAR